MTQDTEAYAIGIDGSRRVYVRNADGSWPVLPTRVEGATPADGGAAGIPPVAVGCNRAWVRCVRHSTIGFYDYVPYSLSNPIGVMSCGGDTKGATSNSESDALSDIYGRTAARQERDQ